MLPAICLCLIVLGPAGADEDRPQFVPADPPEKWTRTTTLPLNTRVLKYCQDNLGKTVGTGPYRGECAALNEQALLYARARTAFPPRKDTPNSDDYVFGKLVCTLTPKDHDAGKVQPGDLLQARGPAKGPSFKGKSDNGGSYFSSLPHHSGVVQAVGKSADSWWLMTYDQNIANSSGKLERWVHQGQKMKLKDMQTGVTIWVYRPIAK